MISEGYMLYHYYRHITILYYYIVIIIYLFVDIYITPASPAQACPVQPIPAHPLIFFVFFPLELAFIFSGALLQGK